MSKLSWTILLVLSMAGIAATYPILKYLNGAVDPYLLAFLRFFVASLALMPIMAYRHSLRPPPKSDLPLFLMLAFTVTIPTVFIVIGVEHTNSIVSAILVNTNPLVVALLAPLLIAEQMTVKKSLALCVGFLGVISVVLNGQSFATLFNSTYFFGSMLLVAVAFLSGLYAIYAKGAVRKYDGLYVTFFSITLGCAMLAAIVGFQGGFAPLLNFTPPIFLSILSIGIIGTAIPWVLWGSSLKHLDAHVAASFKLLIPVFAALYSFLFLTETFTIWMPVGLALISGAIYVVQRDDVRPVASL